MKNKSQKSKEEIHELNLRENESFSQRLKKRGIPSVDTTAEHIGETTFFFSMKRPEIGAIEEPASEKDDTALSIEAEIERLESIAEKCFLPFRKSPEAMELLALPISDRAEIVRKDVETKTDKYRSIDPYTLGFLFDVPFESLYKNFYMAPEWKHFFSVPRITFEEYIEGRMNDEEQQEALKMSLEEQEKLLFEYANNQACDGSAETFHVYDGEPLELVFGFGRFCDIGGNEWRNAYSPYDYRDENCDELDTSKYWALQIEY
ncbi:MAG: hypothetical protein ACR2L1_04225 [Pyrinomonadaceae bacterium]